ncbi:MAG: TraX family protein [Thermoclostridium sp.]|nr:TraX family protein [Thermoclostridium sp.]
MKKCLNGFQLKVIAIVLMVIDHTGALFFPQVMFLRIIGRLSFPLFAFLISQGFLHTRSVKKYLLRLGVCGVLFQIPDWFSTIYGNLTNNPFFGAHYVLNIFATLFFGLAAIALFDRLKNKNLLLSWLAAIAMAAVAQVTGADYGAYGVFYMLMFYLAGTDIKKIFIGISILHAAYGCYEVILSLVQTGHAAFPHAIQLYSMLSAFLVSMYNHEQGRKMKFFFYAFYPGHMILLYLIDALIS